MMGGGKKAEVGWMVAGWLKTTLPPVPAKNVARMIVFGLLNVNRSPIIENIAPSEMKL
jgi:hypothetical protein